MSRTDGLCFCPRCGTLTAPGAVHPCLPPSPLVATPPASLDPDLQEIADGLRVTSKRRSLDRRRNLDRIASLEREVATLKDEIADIRAALDI